MFKLRNLAKYTIAPLVAIALGIMTVMPADAGTTSSSVRPSSSFSSGGFRSADRPSSSFSYSKPPAAAARSDDKPASVYSKPTPAYTPPAVADKPTTTYSNPAPVASSTPSTVTPSYSKPAPVASATPVPGSNGYSKPGASPTVQATVAPKTYTPQVVDTRSVLGATSSRVMSNDALKRYQAERAASKTPPQPVDVGALKRDPGFTSATSRYESVDSYMTARQTNIIVLRQSHPDIYLYSSHMSPNYGAYDSSFLVGLMLGEIGSSVANSSWLYAHQNDPWYAQWHADMMRQAQDNADLRARLDAQDDELARLKSSGVQPTAQSLPQGVDPSVAIAPEAMIANASVVQEEPAESHTLRNIIIVLILVVGGGLGFLYYVGSKK